MGHFGAYNECGNQCSLGVPAVSRLLMYCFLNKAFQGGQWGILEPIMNVEIDVPLEFQQSVVFSCIVFLIKLSREVSGAFWSL